MTVALDTPTQEAFNTSPRPRVARLMLGGFLAYMLLILAGHLLGFAPGFAYLHRVCSNDTVCGLTVENVQALERHGLSIEFYATLFLAVQVLYILVCVGIALLIVLKKPGQWVPLGVSCFLLGFSAYEGVDYPALAATYPLLHLPSQLLIGLGMGLLGMYALLTFPNGRFGSRWVLGYFLFQALEGVCALFISTPVFTVFDTLVGLSSFPIILGILIYRYRALLNAKERVATKWLIVGWSIFLPVVILSYLVLAVTPAGSFVLIFVAFAGFFGCGINIAGLLMAVLYANAFDIDVFVRRTLVYTLLTATLAVLYVGLILGSQVAFATFSPQASQSPLILVASTLIIAALFQPLRNGIQRTIDRRFYRRKYDAARTIAAFSAALRQEVDLNQLHEQLLATVQETMQPVSLSLWIRPLKQQKASGRTTGEALSRRKEQ
jgi:hypothetical protein